MLSNAYFLAKFRFDTAENEPAKNLQNFVKFLTKRAAPGLRRGRAPHLQRARGGAPRHVAHLHGGLVAFAPRVLLRVERFGRRGTEPFEPFEFFQNRNFP